MKKFTFYTIALLSMAIACKKAENLLYSDIYRVQLADTSIMSSTFIYDDAAIVTDTLYIKVPTIGGISDKDRPVKLEQAMEYDISLVRDPLTNEITDTIKTPRPFTAQAGVHYVDFNDPSLAALMVVKANEDTGLIPIVLKRDASLKANSYRLRVQLAANGTFGLGEQKMRARTIVFSDRLERFDSWRNDNYTSAAFLAFGKYSIGKHQFMIDVLKTNIDEAWFKALAAAGATGHYTNYMKAALKTFNEDPANIASGKSPVRETSAADSAPITF
ncbi:DUF4843 domain-containing protein [Chitinophaga horti]|uniref:DUF4843 domain-containing protein n=1 Tax=Chitinophaga horti TaxID=2920382 RepID=A0ABY6IYK5_9BACT|nr:DUF4843 domain-containing protein [Chitinophaga horti]UYQ91169.1 DUF4843 domain-containing protein [Chitinophaga horti]